MNNFDFTLLENATIDYSMVISIVYALAVYTGILLFLGFIGLIGASIDRYIVLKFLKKKRHEK